MLEAQGKFNNLSKELRETLAKKAAEMPRLIKFRFAIAQINPDGEMKTGGRLLYPSSYTVTPVTYDIIDPGDKLRKRVALVKQLKELGAREDSFNKLKILNGWQGIYIIDMEKPYNRDLFAWLMMHPKMENGIFRDPHLPAMITMIDEVAEAKDALRKRNMRIEAVFVANNFKGQDVRNFASAMGWNENEDPYIIKERIVTLAENDPEFFRKFIDEKNLESRALIKRAMDNNIITWVPVESKFMWTSNSQPIAILERASGIDYLDRMADWIATSKNGQEVLNQVRKLLQAQSQPA